MIKATSFMFRLALLTVATLIVVPSILAPFVAQAQVGRTSVRAAKLIGAPVLAADGVKIGQVVDVAGTDDGRIDRIRITTAAPLGFGERTVEIPRPAFTVRGQLVVLDISAGEVDAFPSVSEEDRKRSEDR